MFFEPLLAGLQHYVFLVAEGVRFREALRAHGTGRVEFLVAKIFYQIPKAAASCRLKENGVVALVLEEASETPGGDAARLELWAGIQGWLDPAVDRHAPLRRAR